MLVVAKFWNNHTKVAKEIETFKPGVCFFSNLLLSISVMWTNDSLRRVFLSDWWSVPRYYSAVAHLNQSLECSIFRVVRFFRYTLESVVISDTVISLNLSRHTHPITISLRELIFTEFFFFRVLFINGRFGCVWNCTWINSFNIPRSTWLVPTTIPRSTILNHQVFLHFP